MWVTCAQNQFTCRSESPFSKQVPIDTLRVSSNTMQVGETAKGIQEYYTPCHCPTLSPGSTEGTVPPSAHTVTHGWLTSSCTDNSARYRTSGSVCVISSIARVFAPRSVMTLVNFGRSAGDQEGRPWGGDKKGKWTHFFPRS